MVRCVASTAEISNAPLFAASTAFEIVMISPTAKPSVRQLPAERVITPAALKSSVAGVDFLYAAHDGDAAASHTGAAPAPPRSAHAPLAPPPAAGVETKTPISCLPFGAVSIAA